MNKDAIVAILDKILVREFRPVDVPETVEWEQLERKFSTRFPDAFKTFIELMSTFHFPGDILNVRESGRTNGNDTIALTYDLEMSDQWNADLIPFYSIGNGDYFCLSAKEGSETAVYYWSHDDCSVSKENESFENWLCSLPTFLGLAEN